MPFTELEKCERGAKWGEIKNFSVSVSVTMPLKCMYIYVHTGRCIYMYTYVWLIF